MTTNVRNLLTPLSTDARHRQGEHIPCEMVIFVGRLESTGSLYIGIRGRTTKQSALYCQGHHAIGGRS